MEAIDSIAQGSRKGYIKMWKWLNETLMSFRNVFSRETPFKWFVIVVMGFMTRQEHLGITSIVRELCLNPHYYGALLHFFRSNALRVEHVRNQWMEIVLKTRMLFREGGMPILIGDGVKQSKEGKRIPCVKKLYQQSANSSAPSYMQGHMFGSIGVLVGNLTKLFCLPLSMRIHDGDAHIKQWEDPDAKDESHVVRIIREASKFAVRLGKSILLLDRYYLSVPALVAWLEEEKRAGRPLLSLVMRAKGNPAAYEEPEETSGRGRPRKKGNKVKVGDLFECRKNDFVPKEVVLYGKKETVSFLYRDLLWGQKLYQRLRFVLVIHGTSQSIFVSTDLSLSPLQIIRLYGYRFKIESCFRELKQVIAGFAYRFWTVSVPKLKRYAKSGTDVLAAVVNEGDKARILATHKAVESFVTISCIALGLLQLCSLLFANEINASPLRWLRTKSNHFPSEATTAHFMRKTIFRMCAQRPSLAILRFIRERQSPTVRDDYDLDSTVGA